MSFDNGFAGHVSVKFKIDFLVNPRPRAHMRQWREGASYVDVFGIRRLDSPVLSDLGAVDCRVRKNGGPRPG